MRARVRVFVCLFESVRVFLPTHAARLSSHSWLKRWGMACILLLLALGPAVIRAAVVGLTTHQYTAGVGIAVLVGYGYGAPLFPAVCVCEYYARVPCCSVLLVGVPVVRHVERRARVKQGVLTLVALAGYKSRGRRYDCVPLCLPLRCDMCCACVCSQIPV